MARPRTHESAADRQRAYRERKREVDPALPERAVDEAPVPEPAGEMVSFEGKLLPRKRTPSWSLEQYLEHELAVTRYQLDNNMLRDTEVRGETVADRSERYLRWRYAGYVTGQIASL